MNESLQEKTLSETDAAIFLHITRQRVAQLRTGFNQRKHGKKYHIKPRLQKGIDWFFSCETGKILIKERALIELKNQTRYKKEG